jgi:hypothetical protein
VRRVWRAGGALIDRFGEVFAIWSAGAAHAFPSPDELTEWPLELAPALLHTRIY